MNNTDLLAFEIIGTLLPLGAAVLSLAIVAGALNVVYQEWRELQPKKAEEVTVYEEAAAAHATVDVMADVMRGARGRVSTAMRSTRHAHAGAAGQYAAA